MGFKPIWPKGKKHKTALVVQPLPTGGIPMLVD